MNRLLSVLLRTTDKSLFIPHIGLADQANLTPDGTRPVSANRHKATSSLRASATIITRRIRPLAPAVRS